jgi:O-antigen/teichoic acid export membrane protein
MNLTESIDSTTISASKPKSLFNSATWSLLSTIWFTGVGFLLTPFLIGRLGADSYGLFLLVTSVSGFLGVMDLGLGQATVRYVAYYCGREDLAGINRCVGATSAV